MPLDLLTMAESVSACERLIVAGRPAQHVVVNAGKIALCRRDPRLTNIIRGADLVNADGQSVVWAGRFLGLKVPERVTGIDLMQHLLESCAREGWSVYFLGARTEVVKAVVDSVHAAHPTLTIAGYRDGYFDDDRSVVNAISSSGARLLLVALPSPRKEYFIADHADGLGGLLSVGVGGSFDVLAGHIPRAPIWMQRFGLEWLFRLIREPRKMWKRYLVGNSVFVYHVLAARARQVFLRS